jgi:hypothetical protein
MDFLAARRPEDAKNPVLLTGILGMRLTGFLGEEYERRTSAMQQAQPFVIA